MFDFSKLTEQMVIVGLLTKDSILFNFVLTVAKKSLYISKIKSISPNFSDFVSLLNTAYKMELFISKRNNTSQKHRDKWQGLDHWFKNTMNRYAI